VWWKIWGWRNLSFGTKVIVCSNLWRPRCVWRWGYLCSFFKLCDPSWHKSYPLLLMLHPFFCPFMSSWYAMPHTDHSWSLFAVLQWISSSCSSDPKFSLCDILLSSSPLLCCIIDWSCCCLYVMSPLFKRLNRVLFLFSCTTLLYTDWHRESISSSVSVCVDGWLQRFPSKSRHCSVSESCSFMPCDWISSISLISLLFENLGIFRVVIQVWALIISQLKDEHQAARLTCP